MRIRPATPDDVAQIAALHERHNQRPADRAAVASAIRDYPSAVVDNDDQLGGFAYCGRFALDILELRNLLVAPDLRDVGIGGLLLQAVELPAARRWAAMILANSTAYPTPGKRTAASFYQRHGYELVWRTDVTSVFVKPLSPDGSGDTGTGRAAFRLW